MHQTKNEIIIKVFESVFANFESISIHHFLLVLQYFNTRITALRAYARSPQCGRGRYQRKSQIHPKPMSKVTFICYQRGTKRFLDYFHWFRNYSDPKKRCNTQNFQKWSFLLSKNLVFENFYFNCGIFQSLYHTFSESPYPGGHFGVCHSP